MEAVSLQQLIKDVGWQLLEIYEGQTTAVGTTLSNYTDANFASAANYTNDEFVGSQVVFEEPGYTAAGNINSGVHNISAYDATNGRFTSNVAFRSAGVVAAGLSYFLIRPRGQGSPYRAYLAALRYALDRLDIKTLGRNSALTTAANTYDYTIPAGLGWVYDVILSKANYADTVLTPAQWQMRPGRGLWLRWDVPVTEAMTINLYGYTEDALPAALDGTVVCERADVVDLAVESLRSNRPNASDNARADRKSAERLRFRRSSGVANLRRILP